MKKLSLFSILIVIMTVNFLSSCESEQENQARPGVDNSHYQQLQRKLNADYNQLALAIRQTKSGKMNEANVHEAARNYYGKESVAYQSFESSFRRSNSLNLKQHVIGDLPQDVQDAIKQIQEELENFANLTEYKQYLQGKFDGYASKVMDESDRDIILTYIIMYQESLVFIEKNHDLILIDFPTSKTDPDWWDEWGKCVAGILGTAGSEALAGCGIGAAAGLGVGSVPGCGAGAIVGGVFGGLTGAAIFC